MRPQVLAVALIALAWLALTMVAPMPAAAAQESFIVKVVNQDQFEGNWKQFKGELKKKWGKFTDDDLLVIEGKYDKFEGKLQERYGDRKAEVERWTDDWFEKHNKNK